LNQQIIARIGTRTHSEKGSLVYLAPQPGKVHVFSTSSEKRLSA
jgi:multiple sugar transport system ATP-binding protein